ncbi:hypothetical protein BCR35DRAFT_309491 [Leucosporidium creatinivorum]|uniref:Uncharacterized protein n=1 Tax=Leucosporidium creatinivorum TaxID=106004 RepID=A0A1Y2DGZ3_9BASI|nr:hypothetical protein BCR35DRAFT_309491 [Leucosporidium creatinivorum]
MVTERPIGVACMMRSPRVSTSSPAEELRAVPLPPANSAWPSSPPRSDPTRPLPPTRPSPSPLPKRSSSTPIMSPSFRLFKIHPFLPPRSQQDSVSRRWPPGFVAILSLSPPVFSSSLV